VRWRSNPFFPYMKTRIEEGISIADLVRRRSMLRKRTRLPTGGWRFGDITAFFMNFFPDRSDQPDAPPCGQVWSSQLNHNRRRVAPWLTGGGYS
jgi:hypothetical protein